MALKECHECSGKVSKTAKSCPHCGAKVETVSGQIAQAGCLLMAIGMLLPFVILLLGGC